MNTKNPSLLRPSRLHRTILAASAATLAAAAVTANAQFISLTGATTYTQDFSLLGTTTAAWVDNVTIPGWYAGMNANATADGNLQASDGAADLSGLLNLGSTGAADRALGSKATSTGGFANIAFGVLFKNDTAFTLDITNISYAGELWRTNSVAGTVESWTTFTKISSSVFTDVEPGGSSATANVGTFTAAPAALNWVSPTNTPAASALDGNLPANRSARSADPNLLLAPGQFFMFRWVDTNVANADGFQGIDDFSISFLTLPNNLIYNRAHTAGGAPDGVIQAGPGNYWLKSGAPTALTANDNVFFSQPGDATLTVPANVTLNSINISAASGTYTFTGAGSMSGPLIKSGAGTAVLSNPNNLSSLSLSAGGLLRATAPQNVAGAITIPFDASGLTPTLQTDAEVTAASLSGTELLTKSGPAALTLTGAGTTDATGGVLVTQGSLRTLTAAALGPQNITLDGAGATLAFAHATGDQTLLATTTITPGAAGAAIHVESATLGAGVVFGTADRLVGAGTITKTGPGILRMSANQATFTGHWIIDGGAVQYGTGLAAALGSGGVTVNAGGELAGQNTVVPVANITLSGGALGTRTGAATDFTGTVNVTASSEARLRSVSTPTTTQPFIISGILTGGGDLTLTGNVPLTDSGGTAQLRLRNPGNTFTGSFHATSFQTLTSEPAGGTGSTLNGRPVLLTGGRLRILDNGTSGGGTIPYGNPVTVAAGVATVDVNRQAAGTFSDNAVQLGALTLAGGSTLASTGGNGYQVHFVGATTVTGAGDVTFSPGTAPLILAGGLGAGAFGIVKNGSGVLGIAGDSAYTGNTLISDGILGTDGQLSGTPRIEVHTGAALDVTLVGAGFLIGAGQTLAGTGTVAGSITVTGGGAVEGGDALGAGTLTTGPLTLGTALGHTATIRTSAGVPGGSLAVTGPNLLIANGGPASVTVNVFGQQPSVGDHILIDYDGAIGGTGFAAFTLGSLPPRTTATLVDLPGDSISLAVSAIDSLKWDGGVDSQWTTAAIPNWRLVTAGTTDKFLTNDRVLFNDDALPANPEVSINGADVLPQEVVFDNKAKAYTLTGTHGIAGPIGITKNGDQSATSTVTITGTHSFTGPVTLNAGTIRVATIADAGIASPLGAGSSLVFNGGALEYTGTSGTTNRGITTQAAGATLATGPGSALTLTGALTGAGGLTKTGGGTLTLTAPNTYLGVTTLAGGVLIAGSAENAGVSGPLGASPAVAPGSIVFAGGLLQYSTVNAHDYSGRFSTAGDQAYHVDTAARNVTWASDLTSLDGTLTKTGPGQLTLSGAGPNTFDGLTTASGGALTFSKTSGTSAIGGNLLVQPGAIVAYGTTAGQTQDQIPDTASITIAGGTFGSGAGNTDAAPTAGISDTVANVTVSGPTGRFLSGRGAIVAPATRPTPFTITGTLAMTAGTALVQRGGGLSAGAVALTGPALLSLDGGSGTADNQSRLTVGPGGLTLSDATIQFNAGPSTVTAASVGSIIDLRGDLTSTGASALARLNPTLSSAILDLGAATRTLHITGTLTIAPDVGTPASDLTTAGLHKTGPGHLLLQGAQSYHTLLTDAGRTDLLKPLGTGASTVTASGGELHLATSQTLASLTIGPGATVILDPALPPAPEAAILLESAALPASEAATAAVPEPTGLTLLALGTLALATRRRRTR